MPYTDEFEVFWRCYPPRYNEGRNICIRADKPGAFNEWQKLTTEEKISAFNAVQREKSSKWTPDARKWLKHKHWEDVIAPLKEFDRPLPVEIQTMIDKLTIFKKIPSDGISNYQLNKRRNTLKDKLNLP